MYPATPGADTLALHGPLFPSIADRARPAATSRSPAAARPTSYVQSARASTAAAISRNFVRYARDRRRRDARLHAWAARRRRLGHRRGRRTAVASPTGATQPPAAPDLGHEPRAGRPRDRHRPACDAAEAAAKAVDGLIRGNSKWCSTGPRRASSTVDLGVGQNVSSFVVKHAGLGGESTGWNTGAFTIATSTDDASFSPAVSVTGNTDQPHLPARSRRVTRAVRPAQRHHPGQRRQRGGAHRRVRGVRRRPRRRPNVALNTAGHRRLVVRRQRGPGQGGQRQRARRQHRTSGARRARPSGCRSTSAPASGSARSRAPARRRGRRVRRPGTPGTSTCRRRTTAAPGPPGPRCAATPPTRPRRR